MSGRVARSSRSTRARSARASDNRSAPSRRPADGLKIDPRILGAREGLDRDRGDARRAVGDGHQERVGRGRESMRAISSRAPRRFSVWRASNAGARSGRSSGRMRGASALRAARAARASRRGRRARRGARCWRARDHAPRGSSRIAAAALAGTSPRRSLTDPIRVRAVAAQEQRARPANATGASSCWSAKRATWSPSGPSRARRSAICETVSSVIRRWRTRLCVKRRGRRRGRPSPDRRGR